MFYSRQNYQQNMANAEYELGQVENRISYLDQILRSTYNQSEAAAVKAEMNELLLYRDRLLAEVNGVNQNPYGSYKPMKTYSNISVDQYQRPVYPRSNYNQPERPVNMFQNERNRTYPNGGGTLVHTQDRYANKLSKVDEAYKQTAAPIETKPKPVEIISPRILDILSKVLTKPVSSKNIDILIEGNTKDRTLGELFSKKEVRCVSLENYITDIVNIVAVFKLTVPQIEIENIVDDRELMLDELKKIPGGDLKASYLTRDILGNIDSIPIKRTDQDLPIVQMKEKVIYISDSEYNSIFEKFMAHGIKSAPLPELLKEKLNNIFSNEIDNSLSSRLLLITDSPLSKYFILTKNIDTAQYVIAVP